MIAGKDAMIPQFEKLACPPQSINGLRANDDHFPSIEIARLHGQGAGRGFYLLTQDASQIPQQSSGDQPPETPTAYFLEAERALDALVRDIVAQAEPIDLPTDARSMTRLRPATDSEEGDGDAHAFAGADNDHAGDRAIRSASDNTSVSPPTVRLCPREELRKHRPRLSHRTPFFLVRIPSDQIIIHEFARQRTTMRLWPRRSRVVAYRPATPGSKGARLARSIRLCDPGTPRAWSCRLRPQEKNLVWGNFHGAV
jgi:hypothetical protein